MVADLCLMALESSELELEDSQAQIRKCPQRVIVRGVWAAGVQAPTSLPEDLPEGFPNLKNTALHRPSWEILVVKDPVPPPPVSPEFAAMVEQR